MKIWQSRPQNVSRRGKTQLQAQENNCDIDFLELCKENNLTLTFLRFKLYNKDLSTSHLYKNFQRKLLDNELKQKRTQHRILSRKLEFLKTDLQNHVSRFDFIHLLNLISNFNEKKINSVKLIHDRKTASVYLIFSADV